MGRRRRHDDEDDDALEREWLSKRQKVLNVGRREDSLKTEDETTTSSSKTSSSNQISTCQTGGTRTKKDDTSIDTDKIERQRLKKQQQKERRKQKKAEASKQADDAKQRKEKEKLQLQQIQKEKVAKKKEKKKFDDSKQSKEFKSMRKGVKYMDLRIGNGPAVKHRKKIRVAYTLRAKNHVTGKIIDASKNFGFRLGKGEVIEGYDIGLEGMKVGGIRRLIVPKNVAYKNDDIGAGRGADLFFEIELLYVAP
jgi:FKBP-type peptidyl-prolyl cis-trans isomerase